MAVSTFDFLYSHQTEFSSFLELNSAYFLELNSAYLPTREN